MIKPTKPSIVIPENFAIDGIKTDFDNTKIQNGFDRLQPDVLAGDNLNKLIDDTYQGLNYSIAGTDAINLIEQGEVLTVNDDNELISESIDNLVTNKFVSKAGDTMTGNLSIVKNTPFCNLRDNNFDYTNTSSTEYNGAALQFNDKNDVWCGFLKNVHTSSNISLLELKSRRNLNGSNYVNLFQVGIDANGKPYYNRPQLITTYVSGTSGYNIWSNGYCEQWGYSFVPSDNLLVNLLKTFRDTNYIILAASANNNMACNVDYNNQKTTTSFRIDYPSGSTGYCYWKVLGYLASGQY